MGAELWYHEAPWDSDPSEALRALQAQFLAENYNLSNVLPQHLKWARESLAAAQADDDRYGLVDLYAEKVQLLERLNSEPIPADPAAQIEILRQIYVDSGQGISNVLDVTGFPANGISLLLAHLLQSRSYISRECRSRRYPRPAKR
jgi:hypothetical protein